MSNKKRLTEINDFLKKHGFSKFKIQKMSLDASSRKYYRINFSDGQTKVILDDEHHQNKSKEFALLSSFLRKNKIIAPKIFHKNLRQGLLLIEDFGESDFVQKSTEANEKELLKKGVDILVKLHNVTNVPSFIKKLDEKIIFDNFALFTDWYIPACLNKQLHPEKREKFFNIIKKLLPQTLTLKKTLVLWDYHVNNLMFPENYTDAAVIDFQDAMYGPGLYDLASLLEDERYNISLQTADELKRYYFNQSGLTDIDAFEKEYAFLALLRHMRVLGRFTTLITINKKASYGKYVPHGLELLKQSLQNPLFKEIVEWLKENFPEKYWTIPTDKNITEGFVLAAGRGTRMRHLTEKQAKPMIKVAGKCLIDYSFELLKNAKINDIFVNVCWQKEGIKKHLKKIKNFNITISEETTALETGGGIKKALKRMTGNPFVVVNADNILIDNGYKPVIRQMFDCWNDNKHDILLLLTNIKNVSGDTPQRGDYKIYKDCICRNKNSEYNQGFDFGYVGIAIIHPRIFKNSPKGKFSLRDLFDKAEASGRLGYALSDRPEFWVGTPEAVETSEKILLQLK